MRTKIPLIIIDPATGEAIEGAEVQISFLDGGSSPTVYSSPDPAINDDIPQPLVTDASGRIVGWLERGSYEAAISPPSSPTYYDHFDSSPARDGSIDPGWLSFDPATQQELGDAV